MLSPALAAYLSDRRASCNARFAAARARSNRLSPEDFSLFLKDQLSPLATALASAAADIGYSPILALDHAYDIGLQLVAEKLAGPSAIDAAGKELWTTLFPALANHILSSPRQVIGGLINIRHHVASSHEGRANHWLQRLSGLASICGNSSQLLDAAKILAWQAGLPQFRFSALELAASLPNELALEALNAPQKIDASEIISKHVKDPWFGYNDDRVLMSRNAQTRRFGAFRGFGGLFLSPPTVSVSAQQLLVSSADEHWIVMADAFGTSLLPAARSEIDQARSTKPQLDFTSPLPLGHELASSASTATCFALTSKQSHSVWLGPTPLN